MPLSILSKNISKSELYKIQRKNSFLSDSFHVVTIVIIIIIVITSFVITKLFKSHSRICYFAEYYLDPLNLSRLGILVTAAPCCVFYANETKHQIYWRFDTDDMVFASAFLSHTDKHIDSHTYINIYYHHLSRHRAATCINNLLIKKFILQRSAMSFLFKNHSLVEVIYLLIWFNKTFSPTYET